MSRLLSPTELKVRKDILLEKIGLLGVGKKSIDGYFYVL